MSFYRRLWLFALILAALILIIGLLPGVAHSADRSIIAGVSITTWMQPY